MEVLNILTLIFNLFIILFIKNKIKELALLEQRLKQIQNNIAALVKENSQIIDIIEDLESKIYEAQKTAQIIKECHIEKEAEYEMISEYHEEPPNNNKINKRTINENINYNRVLNTSSKIFSMRQQGLSVQEIAEQLNIPQGEISLKLNLHEKVKSG